MTGTLHRFISESADPIAVLDEDGQVVVTNEGWRQLGGPAEGAHIESWAPLAGAFAVVQREGWARFHGPRAPAALDIDGFLARIDILDRGRYVVRARPSIAGLDPTTDRFFALIENFPFAVVVHRNLRYIYVNRAALAYLGYAEPGELVGQPVTTVLSPDEVPAIRERIEHMVRTGERVPERETRLVRKDGVIIVAETTQFQSRDEDGLASYVVVARDVTERRTLEQRLHQGQRLEAIGRLVGGVAHDFNNILAVIMSHAEWLDSPAGRAEPSGAATEILAAAQRASALTAQLLTFTRGSTHAHGVAGEHSGLARADHAVAEVVAFLTSALGAQVALRLEVPPGVDDAQFRVRMGAPQIEQIVTNLVVNARDALPLAGTVTVRLRPLQLPAQAPATAPRELEPGAYVVLEVEDDGVGMAEDVRARAFEPFFTTKPIGKGTGLGLSTVYGIVRQAGGAVEIHARAPRGTLVRSYLPCAGPDEGAAALATDAGRPAATELAPAPTVAPPLAAAQDKPPTRRVLLVEDDDAVRMVLARLLRQRGFEVTEATDADEAVALATADGAPLDLIVTDVVMPHRSGPQLADEVRARHPNIPILFVSGYSDDVLSARHLDAEGVAFLAKPFTTPELFEAVDRLAPRRAPRS